MVEKAARGGSQCVVLGGDHSMSIGSIAGHARVHSEFGIIWIDAHADINPPTMSPSGNAHGMPLAFLAHELRDMIPTDLPAQFDWLQPWFVPRVGLVELLEQESNDFRSINLLRQICLAQLLVFFVSFFIYPATVIKA